MTNLKSFNFKVHYIQCGLYRYPIGTGSTDVLTHVQHHMPMKHDQHETCDDHVSCFPRGVTQYVTANMFSKAAS